MAVVICRSVFDLQFAGRKCDQLRTAAAFDFHSAGNAADKKAEELNPRISFRWILFKLLFEADHAGCPLNASDTVKTSASVARAQDPDRNHESGDVQTEGLPFCLLFLRDSSTVAPLRGCGQPFCPGPNAYREARAAAFPSARSFIPY